MQPVIDGELRAEQLCHCGGGSDVVKVRHSESGELETGSAKQSFAALSDPFIADHYDHRTSVCRFAQLHNCMNLRCVIGHISVFSALLFYLSSHCLPVSSFIVLSSSKKET